MTSNSVDRKKRVDALVKKFGKNISAADRERLEKELSKRKGVASLHGPPERVAAKKGVDYEIDQDRPTGEAASRPKYGGTGFSLWAMTKAEPPFKSDQWHDFGDIFDMSSPEKKTSIFDETKDSYCSGCHITLRKSIPKSWHGYCTRCQDEVVGGYKKHYASVYEFKGSTPDYPDIQQRLHKGQDSKVSFPFDNTLSSDSSQGQRKDTFRRPVFRKK